MGGKYHLKLNIGERPIANKYREGKMKRTLKRELKVREIVNRETFGTSVANGNQPLPSGDGALVASRSASLSGWGKKPRRDPCGQSAVMLCLRVAYSAQAGC